MLRIDRFLYTCYFQLVSQVAVIDNIIMISIMREAAQSTQKGVNKMVNSEEALIQKYPHGRADSGLVKVIPLTTYHFWSTFTTHNHFFSFYSPLFSPFLCSGSWLLSLGLLDPPWIHNQYYMTNPDFYLKLWYGPLSSLPKARSDALSAICSSFFNGTPSESEKPTWYNNMILMQHLNLSTQTAETSAHFYNVLSSISL